MSRFQAGALVVYGNLGVHEVEGVGLRRFCDESAREYYTLRPYFSDSHDRSYIPTEKEAALRPEQEAATLSDLQLKVQQTQATIPFVLDGQVLEDNLRWCGKDRAWLERTATANTVLPQEILLLIGNETEDYFLLKKEGRQPGGKR